MTRTATVIHTANFTQFELPKLLLVNKFDWMVFTLSWMGSGRKNLIHPMLMRQGE